MPIQTYSKRSIAQAQLESALRLFQAGEDFISVITLAGAAEEILGKLLTSQSRSNSLDSLKQAVAAMHEHLFGEQLESSAVAERANRARNALKHLRAGGDPVSLDLHEEAVDMLNRAIDNFWILDETFTPAMQTFVRAQRAA